MREKRVVFCGGGTGGHTFPALAVAKKLRQLLPAVRLAFIGTGRRVEREILERAGEKEFYPLPMEGLKGRGWRMVRGLYLLPAAFLKTCRLLRRLRPDLVVGVGGYSSGPVVLLASLLGKPAVILEQNVKPGFTNRLLLPWVRRAVAAFEGSLPYFKGKGVFLGNPVREEFCDLPPKKHAGRLVLLVFGGSQGSHYLNRVMTAALPFLQARRGELRIFHQTGPVEESRVQEAYAQAEFSQAEVSAFIVDMPGMFGQADLIICRAGATTVAELIAARKASLVVPFAQAAGGHQLENARELERAGGAEVWTEASLSPERLAERILFYVDRPEELGRLENNLQGLGRRDAAGRIAGLCLELMGLNI
jgi:UDP-N-acetylglucosamine--N-acetylmuramyl-(pentapeptide) pyrophosphoryl-undecaprenol N-acetylglucosamine transferase